MIVIENKGCTSCFCSTFLLHIVCTYMYVFHWYPIKRSLGRAQKQFPVTGEKEEAKTGAFPQQSPDSDAPCLIGD